MSALVSSAHAQNSNSNNNNGETRSVPCSLRVGTKVTRYSNCTVDPGPSRVVHCPELNACLLNQQDPGIDCQAVHFGYAIPVRVVPIGGGPAQEEADDDNWQDNWQDSERQQLAQLVLDADSSDQLSADTLAYLLQRHPQLNNNSNKMTDAAVGAAAAAAGSSGAVDAAVPQEEDIAAIAKQISDHAEAIYQTWKSRGLAPTEILNCHSSGASRFKPALTPTTNRLTNHQPTAKTATNQTTAQQQPSWLAYNHHQNHSDATASAAVAKSPVVELLASDQTNKLERLVSNFVSEDRARQAANSQTNVQQQQQKTLPSSIQFALQKFERKAAGGGSDGGLHVNRAGGGNRATAGGSVAKQQLHNLATQQQQHNLAAQQQVVTSSKYNSGGNVAKQQLHSLATQQSNNNSKFSGGGDTVEVIYPSEGGDSLTKVAGATNTWPLKNKIQDGGKRSSGGYGQNNVVGATARSGGNHHHHHHHRHSTPSSQAEFLDEVAKEEERLINALKTGIIIAAEEPASSSSLRRNKASSSSSTVVPTSSTSPGVDTVDSSSKVDSTAFSNNTNSTTSSVAKRRQVVMTSSTADPVLARASPALNPVRPFLTRGSVAERVLIFEKCPTELGLEKRVKPTVPAWKTPTTTSDLQNAKLPNYSRDTSSAAVASGGGGVGHQQPKSGHQSPSGGHQSPSGGHHGGHNSGGNRQPPHTTLQRHAKANRHQLLLPRFYFPHGKPTNQHQLEQCIDNIKKAFQTLPNCQASRQDFAIITKSAGCPLYWKAPLFIACGGEKLGHVEVNTFIDYWRSVCATCHDDASRFMRLLTRGQSRSHLYPEDFMPLVQDVVDTHPGLTFLKEAAEFHSRYIHTVISRIYYCVNQSWSGQISLSELRRSDLLRVIELLESEEDINQVTQYFSYEHFYVIYCKFWELDRDHDLYIDKDDLARHSDHALSTRLIGRIFSGTVTRGANRHASQLNGGGGGAGVKGAPNGEAKMSYTEFVWFLLAEEDKTHPRAIEYWFRCMDLDGDGYLSMYELEYFYDEQLQRMEAIGIECLPFEDCLCQMLDMIRPAVPGKISLSDLKRCKMTSIFYDTFFNLEKYLDHEQRDPFASQRDHDTEMSDWDRYAAEEYELLVAEEGGNDNHDDIVFEGDEADHHDDVGDDDDDDILSPNLDEILSTQTFLNNNNSKNYLRKKRLKPSAGTTLLNEIGDSGNGNSNGNGESNSWSPESQQPFVTVTDFDNEDDSSSDYAADSDCSL